MITTGMQPVAAQIGVTITPPILSICNSNTYGVVVTNTGGTSLSNVTVTVPFAVFIGTSEVDTVYCSGMNTPFLDVFLSLDSINYPWHFVDTSRTLSLQIQTLQPGDSLSFTLWAGIDCSVIPSGQSTSSLSLRQIWTASNGSGALAVTCTVSGGMTGLMNCVNDTCGQSITHPFLAYGDTAQPTFTTFYNQEQELEFIFMNTGNSNGTDSLSFQFDPLIGCSAVTVVAGNHEYDIVDQNASLQSSGTFIPGNTTWTTIGMAGNHTLKIKLKVFVEGCISTCSNLSATLRWRCAGNGINSFSCNSCLGGITVPFSLKTTAPAIEVSSSSNPPGAGDCDSTCFGESNPVEWTYLFQHTGGEEVDTIHVQIADYYNNNAPGKLSMIKKSDIVYDFSGCDSCVVTNVTYHDFTANGCAANDTNYFFKYTADIHGFGEGDTFELKLSTFNCSDNSHLETRSAHFGISTTNVENALLQNNLIYTNQVGLSTPGTQGIILNGGGANTVSCNTVANTIPHSNTGTIGMNVNLSTNNRMECNVFGTNQVPGTIGPYTGMQFGGDCDIFNDLAGNVMNDCPVGLYLNSASRIGTQFNRGNKWYNPQIGNTTAINQNLNNYTNSLIIYNPNSGIPFYPNTISPPQWFFPDVSGNTFNGCGSQVCIPALAGGSGDEEHLKEVARDSAISFDYREENLNQAQFNLYSLLKEDSVLRTSDSIFQNFYTNKQSVAIGQLQEIKHDLYESGRFTVQQQETFAVADSMVKIKLDSIAVLDSLFAINPLTYYLTERESLVYGINIINGSIDSVLQQHEIMADSLYIAASVKNSAVQPLEIPEGNHKGFNDILIQYRTLGDSSISGNYASLLSIAHQCPYAGGKAVYQARAMLAMLNDSIEYFDDMICLQNGIYRILQNPVSQSSSSDFKIIPNPASQKVTIELADLAEEKVHLEIRNVLGGLIQEIVMDKGIKTIVFSVANFDQGIYFVRIRKDGITLNAKRLAIIK